MWCGACSYGDGGAVIMVTKRSGEQLRKPQVI